MKVTAWEGRPTAACVYHNPIRVAYAFERSRASGRCLELFQASAPVPHARAEADLAKKTAADFSNKIAIRPPIGVRKVRQTRGKQHAILAADFSNKIAIRTPLSVRKVARSRGKQGVGKMGHKGTKAQRI